MDLLLCFLIYLITAFSRFAKVLSKLGIGTYDEWNAGKKIKILLVGYNGARNTGSDVRVVSIARQIKELFGKDNVEITVMTLNPDKLEGYFDEDVVLLHFSSLFPLHVYRACSAHHVAILCEGSTLKSKFANALTLFMCEAAGIMAAQNKPCLAYGAEVGQMEPFLEKAAMRLCRDAYFITRTERSFEALKELGLNGHAGTDAAWLYDRAIGASAADELLRSKGWDGKKPLLGIAVIDPFCWPVRASLKKWILGLIGGDLSGQYDKWYFFSDTPARQRAYDHYIRGISAGVNAFLKEHDYFPVILGMEQLDEKACNAVADRLNMPAAMFCSREYSADIMTGILRRLSALVTSRYHAAVLSIEGGCPIISVSMDERLDSFMKELSMDRKYLYHVSDKHLGKKIYGALTEADENAGSINRSMSEHLVNYKLELEDMGKFMKQYVLDNVQRT